MDEDVSVARQLEASVAHLTDLWFEERGRDTALALINAKIKAERGAAER